MSQDKKEPREFIVCNPAIEQNINGGIQAIRMCIEFENPILSLTGEHIKVVEKSSYLELQARCEIYEKTLENIANLRSSVSPKDTIDFIKSISHEALTTTAEFEAQKAEMMVDMEKIVEALENSTNHTYDSWLQSNKAVEEWKSKYGK